MNKQLPDKLDLEQWQTWSYKGERCGIFGCPNRALEDGEFILSCPDAISKILKQRMEERKKQGTNNVPLEEK